MAARHTLLLDGGMGHLLRRLGMRISGPFGSSERFLGVALANLSRPELVKRAHLAYIEAGAEYITTNNYACVPHCLSLAGQEGSRDIFTREKMIEYISAAGRIAREAAESTDRTVKVAGCLPPLGPSYRVDTKHSDDELYQEYKDIATAIAPYCDVLLCETMASVREGTAAASAGVETGLPVWVSFTLSEEADCSLRSGEDISIAAEACRDINGVEAVLVNCSSIEATTNVIPKLRECLPPSIQVGGYANGMDSNSGGDSSSSSGSSSSKSTEVKPIEPQIKDSYNDCGPESYAEVAMDWIQDGATIVGGCCGIFPEHIAALNEKIALVEKE